MKPRRLVRRMRALLLRARVERELEDELRAHVERDTAERVRRGASAVRARREAAAAFGGMDAVSEACRDVRGVRRLEEGLRDLRFAARSLRRSPAFTVTAAGVLALGIGSATAVFSIAEAVLFRPLPYVESEQLFSVYERNEEGSLRVPSFPTVRDWQAGVPVLLAYVRGETLSAGSAEGTGLFGAGYASEDFFELMGTVPAIGRTWDATEARTGARVAVLAHDTWRESFGGDPGIVGRPIRTDSGPVMVVGVMPEGFAYPAWADMWLPLESLPAAGRQTIERRDLSADAAVIARVVEGATVASMAERLGAANRRLADIHAEARGWTAVQLSTLRDELLDGVAMRVAILGAAVLLLLVISCANVGGLLLARGASRGREFATRRALGASPRRIVQQLLAEGALLVLCGSLAAAGVAWVAVRAAVTLVPQALPRIEGTSVDGAALAFAVMAGCLGTLLLGALPAVRGAAAAPMDLLRGGRGEAGTRHGDRLRAVLVGTEVALATVLVVCATLLFRSLDALGRVDLGVDPTGVAVVQIVPPSPRFDDATAAQTLYERLEAAAARVPGVRSAALVNHAPPSGAGIPTPVRSGRALGADRLPLAIYRTVSAGFFETFGIAIVAGRSFRADEARSAAPVVIVNETLAAGEWGSADPIGRSVIVRRSAQHRPDFGEEIALTVIGVAEDTRELGPGAPVPAVVYVPIPLAVWSHMYVAVKMDDGNAGGIVPALRRALLEVDPSLALSGPGFVNRVRPLQAYVERGTGPQRMNARVLGTFAAVALVLAAVGVFGIVAYLAVQRRREFGLRVSLGARPTDVLALVLRSGIRLVGAGVVTGLIVAAFAARLLRGLLFGVGPGDAQSFAITACLFLIVGLAASIIPAARAARLHPAEILRED